jgi:hypothetical protein
MPTHGSKWSELGLSAEMTTTRLQRPVRIQSTASEMAAVVPAHAALIWRLGPRAYRRRSPMSS